MKKNTSKELKPKVFDGPGSGYLGFEDVRYKKLHEENNMSINEKITMDDTKLMFGDKFKNSNSKFVPDCSDLKPIKFTPLKPKTSKKK